MDLSMLMRVFRLGGVGQMLRRALDAPWRAMAGIAFTVMAMAAIEYDEKIAPGVDRLSSSWSVVSEFSRKLTSFTL
jgi:hypothetical protein